MNTDIAKKLDQVIQLLQLSLLAQRVNTLSDQRILSFNVNGNTIRMSLPDAQCDFIQRVILQTNHFFEAALLSQVAKMGLSSPIRSCVISAPILAITRFILGAS